MTFALAYPAIDPVLVQIGPFGIPLRYALAYLAGLLLGWWCARRAGRKTAAAGAGGGDRRLPDVGDPRRRPRRPARLRAVLQAGVLSRDPLQALQLWHGGMSFHGGLLGVVVAGVTFCARRRLRTLAFADLIFCAAPIGLCLGRIAKLRRRRTGRPGPATCHGRSSSRLRARCRAVQPALRGGAGRLLLFLILFLLADRGGPQPRGVLTQHVPGRHGVFRSFAELFREPDARLASSPVLSPWVDFSSAR